MKISIVKLLNALIKKSGLQSLCKSLRCPDFLVQNKAIDDKSKRKAYNCTRRAGKSVTVAIELSESAQLYPKTNYLYLALTRQSARDILWDTLKDINDAAQTGAVPNESRLELRFPNRSKIKLAGADCSAKEMKKILGQKNKIIAIDEAGSFTINMRQLVYQMCGPTLIDEQGQMILLGTCENIPLTFFEEVTEGREAGWSVHKWTTGDNPFIAKQWALEMEELISKNPDVVNASWFITHYLNRWCTDDNLAIIKLTSSVFIESLPYRRMEYTYVLGIDLGYDDASAFSIVAYHDYDKKCYVIRSYKESELTFTKVAEHIKNIQKKFPVSRLIIDGANKQGVEDMRQRFQLPFIKAEKTEKAFFLKELRDDIIEGNVKIIEYGNDELIVEWKQLQWKDEYKKEEDSRCQNHLSDATLYAWRECKHFAGEKEPTKPPKDSQEYMDELEEKEAIELQARLLKERYEEG